MPGPVASLGAQKLFRSPEAQRDPAQVARKFEALLLGQLLKAATRPMFRDGLLSGGSAASLYREQFMDAVEEATAQRGGSGIARVVERELRAAHPPEKGQ